MSAPGGDDLSRGAEDDGGEPESSPEGEARAERTAQTRQSMQAVDAMLAAMAAGELTPDALLEMLRHLGFRVRSVTRDEAKPRFLTVDLGPQDSLALGLAALFIIRGLPGVLGAVEAAGGSRVVYVRV